VPARDGGDAFELQRPFLRSLAYRMLGSLADADDVVQETFVRWQAADRGSVASPRAWLVTTCTRLAIDELRSARRRREAYVGPWLPEPVVEGELPGEGAELAESLTVAFLLLLERLAPLERAAFILREALGLPHGEVAAALGKSPAASRQIVARARRRLSGAARRTRARAGRALPAAEQARRAEAFFAALRAESVEGLVALLADDAQAHSDGGGRAVAARRVVRGAARVARLLAGVYRKRRPGTEARPAAINGRPGLLLVDGARVVSVLSLDLDAAGRVRAVYTMRNPDKLARVPPVGPISI
jgi:RNA polymerase sigma-70 factor (ECF subfamily)